MSYTKEELEQLGNAHCDVHRKHDRLLERYLTKPFEDEKSREYAKHGFSRRLAILMHCIDRVFATLPPVTQKQPDRKRLLDATVYLQAFVFNVFGCIDNLAHIWVNEKCLTQQDKKPLPSHWVGFRKDNRIVLESLSMPFRKYLTDDLEPWLTNLENRRHALAHRIPLYMPPYYVPDDKLNEYGALEARIYEARLMRNYDEMEKLENEQNGLTTFEPITTHSFTENSPVMFLHSQMICDYYTVDEIAQKLLEEFDLQPESALDE